MTSRLFFDTNVKPQIKTLGGFLTSVTSDTAPGFIDISFALLKLNKQGYQGPIWHPNANKIGFCHEGQATISMRSPAASTIFSVNKGDMVFIPQGYVHDIINIGEQECTLSFAFDSTKPQTMNLASAIDSLSGSMFSSTFSLSPQFLDGLKKSQKDELIKILPAAHQYKPNEESRYKFAVSSSEEVIQTKGGYLQVGTKKNLPTLNGLGILLFGLNPKGGVEPHWHTNAGELVYIVKGRTKITVVDPGNHVEVLEVNGGQGAFAPASHFHTIENVGDDEVEVVAFFNHAEPDYIGIGEVVGAYSNEVLASVFNVTPSYFDSLKKPDSPLVIVPVY